jgi:hypothetical protein
VSGQFHDPAAVIPTKLDRKKVKRIKAEESTSKIIFFCDVTCSLVDMYQHFE